MRLTTSQLAPFMGNFDRKIFLVVSLIALVEMARDEEMVDACKDGGHQADHDRRKAIKRHNHLLMEVEGARLVNHYSVKKRRCWRRRRL